jgi:hypothetical protein
LTCGLPNFQNHFAITFYNETAAEKFKFILAQYQVDDPALLSPRKLRLNANFLLDVIDALLYLENRPAVFIKEFAKVLLKLVIRRANFDCFPEVILAVDYIKERLHQEEKENEQLNRK